MNEIRFNKNHMKLKISEVTMHQGELNIIRIVSQFLYKATEAKIGSDVSCRVTEHPSNL